MHAAQWRSYLGTWLGSVPLSWPLSEQVSVRPLCMEHWPTELASTCGAGVSGVSSGGGTDSGTAAEARRVQSWVQKYECHLVTSRTKYMLRHVLHTLNTCLI